MVTPLHFGKLLPLGSSCRSAKSQKGTRQSTRRSSGGSPSEKPASRLSSMPLADALCPLGFAAHAVRPTRCKRCFRDYSDHKKKDEPKTTSKDTKSTESSSDTGSNSTRSRRSIAENEEDNNNATATFRRRRSEDENKNSNGEEAQNRQRTRVRTGESSSKNEDRKSPSPPATTSTISATTSTNNTESMTEEAHNKERRRSRQRLQILSAQEVRPEDIPGLSGDEDTSADVAFILQVKTSVRSRDDDDETLSTAFTDTTETTLTYGEGMEDLQLQVQQLKTQLEAFEDQCTQLTKERDELMEKKEKDAVELQKLDKTNLELSKITIRVRELETSNEDFKDENNVLKLEIKEIQEDMEKRPSEEEVHNQVEELRTKLMAAESLCEELMEENEDIKREIRDLEDEIEEMQDNFREDQADEYSILKKELEQTAKNCRVLQFKLRKAEKKCDQLESDKNQYEDKLKGLTKGGRLDVDHAEKLRQMELELKTAREVSVNMHTEVESLENKLKHLQEERESLSKKAVADGSKSPSLAKKEIKTESHPKQKDELELDTSQLVRDLHDTMERENDLKEQFKFAEEEAKNLRKKVSFLEQENETLVLQLKKMAATKRGKEKTSRPPSREGDREDGRTTPETPEDKEDLPTLTPAEAQLQLEIMDEETGVLRRKVESLDSENQSFQKQIRELQERLAEKPTFKIDLPKSPPADPKQANIFYEQKVKLLESEAKELRMKLIDKERDNERLSNELTIKQRKGSKATMFTRSRSLDSDTQVDLKKQLQLVEQEALILRSKMVELENENDKLSTETHRLQMRVGKKPPLTSQEELAADNNKLRDKIQTLETKLSSSEDGSSPTNESTANMASMKEQMLHLEKETVTLKGKVETLNKENEKLNNQIKALAEKGNVEIKKRKKIPDSAPKTEFKKAVDELEAEITKLSASLATKQTQMDLMTSQISEHKKTTELLSDEKATLERKLKQQISELERLNLNLKSDLKSEKDALNKLQQEAGGKKSPDPRTKDAVEKARKLEKDVEQLKKDLETEKQKKPTSSVRFEDLRKAEEDKHKLQKEIADHQRRLAETEKKMADLEQTNKEAEKAQRNLRHKIDDLNAELDQEKAKLKKVDSRQNEVTMGWLKERDEMKKQMSDLQKKSDKLQKEVEQKDKDINEKDNAFSSEKKKKDALQASLRLKEDDLKHAKDNSIKLKAKLKELEEKFIKVDKDMEELTDRWRKLDALYKKEQTEWNNKHHDLESQLKLEKKQHERAEQDSERQLRDRDEEMITMREKLRKLEGEARKSGGAKDGPVAPHVQEKVTALQKQLTEEKQEYDDLTSKYEMLEEEHVVTKARLVTEKEHLQVNHETLQRNFSKLEGELKSVRDTFNLRQDTWIKEKLELQEKIKDLEEKFALADSSGYQAEAQRFKRMVDEKTGIIEQFRKSERNLKDEVDRLKRQGDDLRNKLSDLERASRGHGRSYGSDNSQKEFQDLKNNLMKTEIEELRTKFQQEEKVHRSEVTALKMMNDVKMAQMQDEVQMLHIQIGKFRRERDTFKEMLDGAQRTISDLKSDSIRRRDSSANHEVEDAKVKVSEMRKLVEKLQDQLDNADRTNSHLKTEYLTDKASWEIKVSEMQAKVNELEESIILQGGKSRIFGIKTKLELAWQKEREEQQRLLNESHRMAKELRQRVIDLENERDRERGDAKSQLQQLRSTVESDQAETQIKIAELQADLLELRDAHSKMRTTNDRIKRDRDKMERDRDELKMKLNETQHFQSEDFARITAVADELSRLAKLMPSLLGQPPDTRPPSRPSTPTADKKLQESFQNTLSKVTRVAEEFRRSFGMREEERLKRNLSFRRALSATDSDLEPPKPPPTPTRTRKDDPLSRWQNPQRVSNLPPTPPSMYITPPRQRTAASTALHRKSLSLDQSLAAEMEAGIWKAESGGSSSSLQDAGVVHTRSRSSGGEFASGNSNTLSVPAAGPSPLPRRKKRLQSSQSSLDSSPSTSRDASMEKELRPSASPVPSVDAYKKTAKDRFFGAGKSRSIEETSTGERVAQVGLEALKPAVGAAVPSELNRPDEKSKDFRSKISNIFNKKPPMNREGSLDSAENRFKVATLSAGSKGLRPPDPKQKAQYRSTGALHTTTVRTLPK